MGTLLDRRWKDPVPFQDDTKIPGTSILAKDFAEALLSGMDRQLDEVRRRREELGIEPEPNTSAIDGKR